MRTLLVCFALAGCDGDVVDTAPSHPPGELLAGVARVRMPVPVGIGTSGFGPFGVSADPSPFSELYPATTGIHGHPDFKAVVVSRGEGHEIVFLRLDMIGVLPGIRPAVLAELRDRTGRDFDDSLIIGATHTHSGPGRVLAGGGPYDLIGDKFLPEHYERMVGAMADAVEAALADLRPARVGHVMTTSAGHADRRCEDGRDFTDSQVSILGVERDGRVDALLLGYAVHGTTVGIEELTLTGDVHGAIEDAVEARFDHPVTVAMFNAWGGDMSPSAPDVAHRPASPIPSAWDRQDAIALAVSDAVETALPQVAWAEAPEVRVRTRRVPIDRQVLGYDSETFLWVNGATFCGAGIEADCSTDTIVERLDEICVPFTEEYPAPSLGVITAGRIGDMALITFSGEPVTEVGLEVVEGIRAAGVEDVFFIGYSQDYLGYSLLADDWWQGGYEANGTLWGPNQGGYLAREAVETWVRMDALSEPMDRDREPAPLAALELPAYEAYVPEAPIDPATVAVPVPASVPVDGVVTWTIRGLDPWLGAPLVTLEDADGSEILLGGRPVDSDGYGFGVQLSTFPTYRQSLREAEREFRWTFTLPVTRPVEGVLAPDLRGSLRLRARLADGSEVVSGVFTVE